MTWELLLAEQEHQKTDKYRELAADLATQHPGWRVTMVPIVMGYLGTLRGLWRNIMGLSLFTRWEAAKLIRVIQFEVLCSMVRILQSCLAS